MPPWLTLILLICGFVLWVGIEAALTTANPRIFWVAVKQYGTLVLALAIPGALIAGWIIMFN